MGSTPVCRCERPGPRCLLWGQRQRSSAVQPPSASSAAAPIPGIRLSPNDRRSVPQKRSLARFKAENLPHARSVATNQLTSDQNDYSQHEPSEKIRFEDAGAEREHGRNHRKIIRAGVAAVRACASLCIQDARRSHPDQCNDPNHGSERHREKQASRLIQSD